MRPAKRQVVLPLQPAIAIQPMVAWQCSCRYSTEAWRASKGDNAHGSRIWMMTAATYRTNLRCASCLDTIRPHLDALPGLLHWSADMESPGKPLTIEGDVPADAVRADMQHAGYEILGEFESAPPEPKLSS